MSPQVLEIVKWLYVRFFTYCLPVRYPCTILYSRIYYPTYCTVHIVYHTEILWRFDIPVQYRLKEFSSHHWLRMALSSYTLAIYLTGSRSNVTRSHGESTATLSNLAKTGMKRTTTTTTRTRTRRGRAGSTGRSPPPGCADTAASPST